MDQQISRDELQFQLNTTKSVVAELESSRMTSAAAAYYSIQTTLERFLEHG